MDDSDFEEDCSNDSTSDESNQLTLSESGDLEEAEDNYDVGNEYKYS